jgi:hypothetical protein
MASKYLSGFSRYNIKQNAIRRLFIFAVVIGSIGTSLGTLIGSPVIAIGIPLAVMCSYIWYTSTAEVDVPASIVGDSYYYLGFILTLVALTASLISLSKENVAISNIIGSFGAAMLTTIVGLIARLVTTTFSIESAQRREQLDKEIEKELDKFLGQLRTMTDKVTGDFITMSTDITASAQITKDSFTQVGDSLTEATEGISEKIETSVDGLVERINSVKVDPAIVEDTVKESLAEFSKGIGVLKNSYSGAVDSVKKVNDKLISQYENLQSVLISNQDNVSIALAKSVEKGLQGLTSSLSEVEKAIDGNKTSLNTIIAESNATVARSVDSYVNQIDELKGVTGRIVGNIKDVEIVSISASKVMNKHHKVLEQEALLFKEKKGALDGLQLLNQQLLKTFEENTLQIERFEMLLGNTGSKLEHSLNNLDEATASMSAVNEFAVADLTDTYKRLAAAIKKLEVHEQ